MLFHRSTAFIVVFLLSFLFRSSYAAMQPDAALIPGGCAVNTAGTDTSSGAPFYVLQGGNSQGIVLCLSGHRLIDARGMNTLQNNVGNGSFVSID